MDPLQSRNYGGAGKTEREAGYVCFQYGRGARRFCNLSQTEEDSARIPSRGKSHNTISGGIVFLQLEFHSKIDALILES